MISELLRGYYYLSLGGENLKHFHSVLYCIPIVFGVFLLTLSLHLLFADSEFSSKAPSRSSKAALMLSRYELGRCLSVSPSLTRPRVSLTQSCKSSKISGGGWVGCH